MTHITVEAAFSQGKADFHAGLTVEQYPSEYPANLQEMWEAGWSEACSDDVDDNTHPDEVTFW